MADPKPDANPGNPRAGEDAGCPTDAGTVACPEKPLPILEIVNRKNNAVVSGTNQTVIIGQKIQLMVRTKPSETSSNIEWTVSGGKIKDYTLHTVQAPAGLEKAEPTDLQAADLQGENLDFYWVKGGNETVQVAATVRGSRLTASVSYAVLAPTHISMTSTTGAVDVSDPHFSVPGIYLHFGTFATNPLKPGIEWTLKATAPAGGDGHLAATQLANPDRHRTLNNGSPMVLSSGGDFQLDITVPYDTAVEIEANTEATWKSSDSPGTRLTNAFTDLSIHDEFKIYLMYRPAGNDRERIWVTIGLLTWNWAGKTTRTGVAAANHWNPPSDVSNSRNPSGAASSELPRWTANAAGLGWTSR